MCESERGISRQAQRWSSVSAQTAEEAIAWATHPDRAAWAFRGQPDATFENLRPSLFRMHPSVPPRVAFRYECASIEHFRRHATMHLSVHEQLIVRETIFCTVAVMRHYGAPTRLLDWTGNPIAALYFACSQEPSKDAMLWGFNGSALVEPANSISLALPKSYDDWARACAANPAPIQTIIPQYSFPLLTAQDGFFTIAPQLPADHAELLAEAIASEHRQLLRINAAAKEGVLEWLHRVRMSPQVLFPSVDGVARYLSLLESHLIELPTTASTRRATETFSQFSSE